jgi:hypothetical protein
MLAFVVIDCSYLRFHTLFTRGPKVRLFARHSGSFGLPKSSFAEHDIVTAVANKKVALSPLGRNEYEKRR